MHSRFPAGWRFTLWTAVLVSLILLPASDALARGRDTVLDDGSNSLRAKTGQDAPTAREEYARANYVWPYEVGPFYGDVGLVDRQAPGVVHTAVGTFDLVRGELSLPAALKTVNKLGQQPAQYFIISIDPKSGEAGAALLAAIEAHGGAVVQRMQVSSVIARVTPSAMEEIRRSSEVVAVEPYHPAFKLTPYIGRVPLNDPAKALSSVYALKVQLFKGESAER